MDCLFPEHAYDASVIQQPMVQTPERSQLMPSEGLLALHDHHQRYANFNDFQPQIAGLLQQGSLLAECIQVTKALGFLEPLTGEHIPPEAIQIQGPNYRESLIANGLLSRNRAVLVRLEQLYGSIEDLRRQEVYLVEAISGFAVWLRRKLEAEKLVCSEYLEDAEKAFSDIPHQDLCALTFPDSSFDLVLCNELFEHVQDLDLAFREIARVLRPGGRLLSTFPLAFGQQESIKKALYNSATGESVLIDEAEYHGDPVRPEAGSLVYRIPGWEVQDQLQAAGFADVAIHHIVSWKHGVLGSDLPGVLVVEAQR
jgi:SAM-dependent methyltransferase